MQGAINSARGFHAWASALGYSTKLLIDDPEPVTLPRFRQDLDELLRMALAAPLHRLVLYFAGHGLIREAEEGLWLLFDWDDELRAVAVEGLRRRLYMHNIKQIAIFADACRNLPADVQASDLTPDAVLGRGPIKSATTPEIDKFISTQDGSDSYVVPGDNIDDDRCIFSGVLLEGLWGTKPSAFSKIVPHKITSQSLAAYLNSEVPLIASRYKFTLNPNAIPTFSNGDDIYFGDDGAPSPPTFPQWPPPERVLARMGLSLSEKQSETQALISNRQSIKRRVFDLFQNLSPHLRPDIKVRFSDLGMGPNEMLRHGRQLAIEFNSYLPSDAILRCQTIGDLVNLLSRFNRPLESSHKKPIKSKPQMSLVERLREQARPHSFEGQSGFAVEGRPVHRVWVPPGTLVEPRDATSWRLAGSEVSQLQNPVPAMIEFDNGLTFGGTALPQFIGTVLCDDRGVSAVVYRQTIFPAETGKSTEEALAALEGGGLRADAAADLAVQLRQLKHADPVLGVISAYLYDAVGDVESIRRMAFFTPSAASPYPTTSHY